MTTALAVVSKQEERFFTPEQEKLIRDSCLGGASEAEAAPLLEVARARRLNPLTKQIHFVKRKQWDPEARDYKWVWSFQVGIDGFRSIAERTGLYDGQDEPEFTEGKEGPTLCKVRVYRKGIARPFVGFAYFDEYAQTFKDRQTSQVRLNDMWAKGKHFMLAKCAEAAALRKAFPEDLGGFYEPAEMPADAPAEKDVTPKGAEAVRAALSKPSLPAPAPVAQRIEAPKPGLVVDVAPGETEEQAETRAREPGEDEGPPEAETAPAEPERTKATQVKYGKDKNKYLCDLDQRGLAWQLTAAQKSVDAPSDPKWLPANKIWLATVEAEVARRQT